MNSLDQNKDIVLKFLNDKRLELEKSLFSLPVCAQATMIDNSKVEHETEEEIEAITWGIRVILSQH